MKYSALPLLLSAVLVACSGNSPKPPGDTSLFTSANAWAGSAPADATTLSQDEFAAKVKSGELQLITAQDLKAQEQKWRDQYAQDRAFLEAIPEAQRSPDVQALLSQTPDLPQTPGGDYIISVKNNDGSTFNTITLGKQSRMRQIVETYKQAATPANALAAYQAAYDAAPTAVQGRVPRPVSLAGQSVSQIMDALDTLDDVLASVENLDNTRLEPQGLGGATLHGQSLGVQSGPGNGVDTQGTCTPSASGIFSNFWWPLKRFTTPVKQQGMRGTCWGFAAVAALESRELVVNGQTLNLSEQYLVNKNKRNYDPSDFWDGYSAESALQNMLSHNDKIPGEGAWTYNQAYGRPSTAFDSGVAGTAASYNNACSSYSGYCSQTAHESPVYCTTVPIFGTFCAYYTVVNVGGGVDGSNTTTVWHNQWSSSSAHTRRNHFPVNTLRALLANGQPLLASFGVFKGWDNAGATGGFVTDYSEANGRGGHVVLMTGFISNAALAKRLPNAPQGAGGGYFIIKNSWGCGAGDAGYYYVPVDYVTKFFSDLSRLNMPSSRSAKWNSEVVQGNGGSGPQVSLTAPVNFAGGIQLPVYFNFQKPKTFTAKVSDATDGPNCCGASVVWTSAKLGKVGSGASASLNLSGSGASDTITATAKDSDGNSGQISLFVHDGGYPLVTVLYPPANATLPLTTPIVFQVQTMQFLGGPGNDSVIDCTPTVWKSSKAGEGPWSGCVPSVKFTTAGPRTLTASLTFDDRTDTKSVNVTVAQAPAPPTPTVVVTITAPKLPYSVGTPVGSALVNFAGSVTVNGLSASCALLSWKAVSATHNYTAGGCAPRLDMALGSYTVTATYTSGAATGSASGSVTVYDNSPR
ncbi:hypothetical protein DKM44_08840 [Deinococcus irradiatisoli]|uniref:Peptidase C1A papain C-terminal domain-containing protein n=1 Tax=Deinococcus irradiatisoli TaxID=2202254 RepID=A0A2Z3JR85_9DEIO|nr:C1 family peptidase [Deinococcus irradiatisoli]AWN23324.1 hypothetical protein DKM44_08840 [Deinococcus irradiatisoli]